MGRFGNLDDVRATMADLPRADAAAADSAAARNGMLTKPPGALGRLEDLAIWYAGWRGTARPRLAAPQVAVFAGNHGVAARGVSAFPAAVTAQMVANFRAGGAAINQLAALHGAAVDVIALDLDNPTADFTEAPALGAAACAAAVSVGWDAVRDGADLLVVGEMGIGNTTAAAALAAALWGGDASDWTGAGTGVAGDALAQKIAVVSEGLRRHADARDPWEVLRCFGGREIAAMAGAILRARHLRMPVILDGFICCAAASVLARADPRALDHCVAGHLSQEAGHGRLLAAMGLWPLLALDLRLGEGTGAALAIGILKGAVACQSGMATFDEAGVG